MCFFPQRLRVRGKRGKNGWISATKKILLSLFDEKCQEHLLNKGQWCYMSRGNPFFLLLSFPCSVLLWDQKIKTYLWEIKGKLTFHSSKQDRINSIYDNSMLTGLNAQLISKTLVETFIICEMWGLARYMEYGFSA